MVKASKKNKPRYWLMPILENMGACVNAVQYVRHEYRATFAERWATGPRGDWMLWLATSAEVDRRLVVMAACGCVEDGFARHPPEDPYKKLGGQLLVAARQWAYGEQPLQHLESVVQQVQHLRSTQARAAYHAASIASCSPLGARMHASFAVSYTAAAATLAPGTGYTESQRRSADIVRGVIPWKVVESAMIKYARRNNCLVELTP